MHTNHILCLQLSCLNWSSVEGELTKLCLFSFLFFCSVRQTEETESRWPTVSQSHPDIQAATVSREIRHSSVFRWWLGEKTHTDTQLYLAFISCISYNLFTQVVKVILEYMKGAFSRSSRDLFVWNNQQITWDETMTDGWGHTVTHMWQHALVFQCFIPMLLINCPSQIKNKIKSFSHDLISKVRLCQVLWNLTN